MPRAAGNASSDHARARSSASYPACGACAGWRHLSPHSRPRQRTGRSRPRSRHPRRQLHRRRTCRAGAGRNRAAPEARRASHGHGAKAGAILRLRRRSDSAIRVYTPHGGSLHFPLSTLKGAVYARLERALMNNTELFLFESAFARNTYQRTIGMPKGLVRCVFNGVTADEFEPVARASDAADVVYVGEFRHIKGADLLIDAVARLRADGKPVTLTLAGDGEEMATLKAQVQRLGLTRSARFIGHVKARYGFSKGKLLVVPSRGDSMPYVVIEAGAAGIPMVAANVGGIPEIFNFHTDALFAPNNVGAMADAIKTALEGPDAAEARAKSLRERIFLHFSQKAMVEGVLAGYRDAFEALRS